MRDVNRIANSVLELIGSTPLVRLNKVVEAGSAEVLGKCENLNPAGSVKDRIALSMIEAAEKEGRIKPGDTIVEPTSGNTGIGLAMVAAVKGYHLIVTMPEDMSLARRDLLARFGAEVILTTEKDGVRLESMLPLALPVATVSLALEVEPADAFRAFLAERLAAERSAAA